MKTFTIKSLFFALIMFVGTSVFGQTIGVKQSDDGSGNCAVSIQVCYASAADVPASIVDGTYGAADLGGYKAKIIYNAGDRCFTVYYAGPCGVGLFAVKTIRLNMLSIGIDYSYENTLPIELLRFVAEYNKGTETVDIEFVTATQLNVESIELMRSYDQDVFEPIEIFTDVEDSAERNTYTVEDADIFGNKMYYQIRTTNLDGTVDLSSVITVTIDTEEVEVEVFPNPAVDKVSIKATQDGMVSIFNLMGAKVYEGNAFIGVNNYDLSNIPNGIYMVQFFGDKDQVITKRLVVSK